MTNARSRNAFPWSEFLRRDFSSFRHSALGNSLDIRIFGIRHYHGTPVNRPVPIFALAIRL